MCGIAGYFDLVSNRSFDLEIMISTLKHRGPDYSSVKYFDNTGLSHSRLSIVDLTDIANQPFFSNNKLYAIVFNGEIYNYKEIRSELLNLGYEFISKSDTEVVLYSYIEWGEDCVQKFNGMWAFVIYNIEHKKLFCSRDRFGIKPFYYLIKDNVFFFASEPKAILEINKSENIPDLDTINNYIEKNISMQNGNTFFKNIKYLEPSCNITISKSDIIFKKYWSYPINYKSSDTTEELLNEFKDLLTDAIRIRKPEYVNITTTMSGGLDSTSIVSIYNQLYPNERHEVFSAIFKSGRSEEKIIDNFSKNKNIKVNKFEQSSENFFTDMVTLIKYQDSPLLSSSAVSMHNLMIQIRKAGYKVSYDGQGADEILAGYENLFYFPALQTAIKSFDIIYLIQLICAVNKHKIIFSIKNIFPNLFIFIKYMNGYRNVLKNNLIKKNLFLRVKNKDVFKEKLNQSLYDAHSRSILPGLLLYGDSVSMASSVEVRLPFMDYRLVEFSFKLPCKLKYSGKFTKMILREAMKNNLPNEIYGNKNKNGFDTPLRLWMLSDKVKLEKLIQLDSNNNNIFDEEKLKYVFKRYINSKNNDLDQYMFRVISVVLWYKIYIQKNEI